MKRFLTLPVLVSLAILGVALLAGAPFADASSLGALGALGAFGLTGDERPLTPRQRTREQLPAFQNVVATGRASCDIPRYAMTLYRVNLKLAGTAFTKAMITEIRVRLGSKTLYLVSGSDLDKINNYKPLANDAAFLTVDFTQPRSKDRGAEFIGGLDLTALPEGKLFLEVNIVGATAPQLTGLVTWGPPQANKLISRLLQYNWSSGIGTGKQSLPLSFGGAMVQRIFILYTGADYTGIVATAAAWAGNVGNGVMGAIAVAAGTKPGVYKLVIVEPGSNIGTFMIYDPDGVPVSKAGAVATAYAGGGLSFTLADGSTDFASGDGFDITVPSTANGNLSRVEVKKNGRVEWDMEDAEARFQQREYLHVPQSRMYVVDFVLDNRVDGILQTADAKSLEVNCWLTAADNLTVYAETLDTPENN